MRGSQKGIWLVLVLSDNLEIRILQHKKGRYRSLILEESSIPEKECADKATQTLILERVEHDFIRKHTT